MQRWRVLDALAGLLAFAVAAAFAELIAAVVTVVSPIVAVGDGVIRLAPAAAVHFATSTFGTYDKPVLLSVIVVITLVFGALVGMAARTRPMIATIGFTAWWAVCSIAVWADQTMVVAAGAVIGGAALAGCFALNQMLAARLPTERILVEPASQPTSANDPRQRTPSRRAFFTWAAASAGASAVAAAGAQRLGGRYVDVEAERRAIVLPAAQSPLRAVPPGAALDTPGLSPLITPNSEFYRIDTALSVPRVDLEKWRLRITGMVERPLELTYAELATMPIAEADVTLTCVSNEVGGKLLGNARWLGVPLPALLERAGVHAGATQIVGRSVDGFTAGFPTEVALDGRAAMVALAMNGQVLPTEHGFPARLVVPGLYGYVSATKWLTEIHLTTLEAFDAYWIPRGWSKLGPIKTQSRIDVPTRGRTIPAGRTPIAGVAWGGIRSISKVEVRVTATSTKDAPWMMARLGDPLSHSTWRQWVLEWDAQPGEYDITVCATDGDGETQTQDSAAPAPSGATGWHTIRIKVADR